MGNNVRYKRLLDLPIAYIKENFFIKNDKLYRKDMGIVSFNDLNNKVTVNKVHTRLKYLIPIITLSINECRRVFNVDIKGDCSKVSSVIINYINT